MARGDARPDDPSRARIVHDRLEWMRPHVERAAGAGGATGAVLDLGCIDARHPERIETSLHAALRRIHPALEGIDLDAAAVAAVRERGFEVRQANAECDDLGGPYQVVVAGELIEHVDNPGLLLDNVRRHLVPRGRLLLTTPNPFYANQISKILRHGRPQVHAEHRFWFSPQTLAVLLDSRGFEVEELVWIAARRGPLRRALARLRPHWSAGFGVVARRRP